ncbi:MAG: hypothetical protein IPL05_07660 [Betaproteobacteria bacterium]|nr:hypothetical protein [Betaproteobacteria bacterium]
MLVNMTAINGIYSLHVERYVQAIANRNPHNPVAEWIRSTPGGWQDRLSAVINTLKTQPDYPPDLRRTLMHKWFLSAVAAIFTPSGFSARGVLVLQARRLLGKPAGSERLSRPRTSGKRVTPRSPSRRKLKGHGDYRRHPLIVEIGELDSSFRKDIARPKGLITSDTDKVRLPYHRRDSEFPRRTVSQ